MRQQGFFAFWPNAGNRIKWTPKFSFHAFRSMRPNCKTVGLIPEALKKVHRGTVLRQGKARFVPNMELFTPGMPVWSF